jgi:hypothetical protein
MKVNVKGHIRDLLAFRGLVGKRQKRIAKASPEPIGQHPINRVAQQLHPATQNLVIASIQDETETSKTFRMVADREAGTEEPALFRAGQYLSLKVDVDGTRITRPYSISSAPSEALGADGFYDINHHPPQCGWVPDSAHLAELGRWHEGAGLGSLWLLLP